VDQAAVQEIAAHLGAKRLEQRRRLAAILGLTALAAGGFPVLVPTN
jgi:hypothetical protein